jgi:tetratricopeptide (TPR) repeat protein
LGDRRGEAAGLCNVGGAYRALGEPQKAQEYWIQSVAAFEAVSDRRGLAAVLSSLGTLGDGPDALRYLNRSLAIRREIGDRQGEVRTLGSISAVEFRMAEHRKAREWAEAALELARKIGFRHGEGVSMSHAADADLKLGDRERARDRLSQAAAIFREEGSREFESTALAALAHLELSAGNLEQALAYSGLAAGISESIRGSVTDPELRASFRAYRNAKYGLYIDALMGLHQRDPTGGFDMLALEANERSRARSLIEMLAESKIDLRQALSPDQRRREEQILDRISQAQRELFHSGLPEARATEIKRQLAATERELDTFGLELNKSSGLYAAAQYGVALSQDRIRREILGRDTSLIEFALGEKQSWVWVLTPQGSVSAVLPPRKKIEQLVEAYRKELGQRSSALTVRASLVRLDALGAELYGDLLAPVEAAFRTAQRLIVVPDGLLAYLPFEAQGGGKQLLAFRLGTRHAAGTGGGSHPAGESAAGIWRRSLRLADSQRVP